jgi:ATP-dependent DNA ligase
MRPMLLTDYCGPDCMTWPAWVERKYDGVRCVIVLTEDGATAYSREGHVLAAGQAAADWCHACGLRGLVDGELVGASLSVTIGAVKRGDPSRLRFKAWDYLTPAETTEGRSDRPLMDRRSGLVRLLPSPAADASSGPVDLVPGQYVDDDAALEQVYRESQLRQWEGVVVKDVRNPYVCGTRSRGWRRCKPGEGK